ncbi:MAG: aminotransferase [Pseudomonadota bacterium]
MALHLNEYVLKTSAPPIAEATAWLDEGLAPGDMKLLDLAQAVPSYPPPDALLEHLGAAARAPDTAFYTDILGLPALRTAYADSLSRIYDATISADQVAITTGCNHAFCLAIMAVAEPGSEVLLAAPYYFNHEMWFAMQNIGIRPLPCVQGAEGMVPDPEQARALIGPKTRAIVLISPNNPTGTIYATERLAAFAALAKDQGIALILDETYRDFLPGAGAPHGLFQADDWGGHFIQLYSFSKAYSLTGYRVGALAAGREVIAQVDKVADTLSICPPHIGQLAALYGIEHLDAWREGKRQEALARVEALDAAFAAAQPPFELVSRGAFFAYLRHPCPEKSAVEVARALVAEQALFCLPGSYFGPGQERYLRLAFANAAPEEMPEIARRLKAFGSG